MACEPPTHRATLAFVRAADTGSFTVAAEQLGPSRSTVGKRIIRLEARLGVRLLQRGVPATVEDLTGHNCLAFEHGGRTAQWHFQVDGVQRRIRIDGNFIATQAEALRDATTAGVGIGQLATFLISDERRTRRLVPVIERRATEDEPLSIVYPVRTLLTPRVEAFVDLLLRSWQPVPRWDRA